MLIKADFHIHSCLSPCGSLEMSPSAIVKKAREVGLNLIAITDHNCSLNAPAFYEITKNMKDLKCFYGMEVTSEEEVHNVCLFDSLEPAMDFSDFIYDHLLDIKNYPEKFGDQVYVNENEEILGEVEKFLGSVTDLSIEDLNNEVHRREGLFIPAHIDRPSYSMSSQLGFLPAGDYDAVELSKYYIKDMGRSRIVEDNLEEAKNYPIITGSDSHFLSTIGVVWNEFNLDFNEISLKSVKKILDSQDFEVIVNF